VIPLSKISVRTLWAATPINSERHSAVPYSRHAKPQED